MSSCLIHPLPWLADPLAYFARIRHAPGAVLLDSGQPVAQRGRFDVLSAWPLQVLQALPDESAETFLQRLRNALASLGPAGFSDNRQLPFAGGLIGYLAYDFGRRLECLPAHALDDLQLPDARFGLYSWALISDHQLQCSQLVFHPSTPAAEQERLLHLFSQPVAADPKDFSLLEPFKAQLDQSQYRQAFERVQGFIQAGDCYQVNLAQRFQARCQGDPWSAYRALREACPTPFSAYLALAEDSAILSLSPERFLRVQQRQVETRPIKGTRQRSSDPEEDRRLASELLQSKKERAENLMIVDLLRNDLGRSCATGSVEVEELFALESYPNVHHMVSSIRGRLAAGKDALDLLAGSFPGGSITGAPKIRAMQIIDELEPARRSIYCGSILYLDVRGEMDSSIAIRSLLIKDGKVSCWGGGGIVADSACAAEYQESITKIRVLLETLEALQ
jgi:para-aminobenzoate synthetase component 1